MEERHPLATAFIVFCMAIFDNRSSFRASGVTAQNAPMSTLSDLLCMIFDYSEECATESQGDFRTAMGTTVARTYMAVHIANCVTSMEQSNDRKS